MLKVLITARKKCKLKKKEMICLEKLSHLIAAKLVKEEIINDDDFSVECCVYGLELILSSLFIFATMMTIAAFTGLVTECLAFAAFFCSLRILAGGFHCKNYISCFLVSVSLWGVLCVLLLTDAWQFVNSGLFAAATFVFTGYIALRAPIEHKNRPLSSDDIKNIKGKARFLCALHLMVAVILVLLQRDKLIFIQCYSDLLTTLFMLIPSMEVKGNEKDHS